MQRCKHAALQYARRLLLCLTKECLSRSHPWGHGPIPGAGMGRLCEFQGLGGVFGLGLCRASCSDLDPKTMLAARETRDRPPSVSAPSPLLSLIMSFITDSSLADHRAAAPRDNDQHVMYYQ